MHGWVLLMLAAPPAPGPILIADDFESGQLLQMDGGPWTTLRVFSPLDQAFISPLAAHRGDGGFRIVDGNGAAGPGPEVQLSFSPSVPLQGAYFERMWFRVNPTQALGDFDLLQDIALDGVGTAFYPLAPRVYFPDGGLVLFAENAQGLYQPVPAGNRQVQDGAWHLLELAVFGLGTDAGQRCAWVDGQVVLDAGMDWSGLSLTSFEIGETHVQASQAFTGTVDFDDVRSSVLWPATFLDLLVPDAGPFQEGQCIPAEAALLDERDALAPAPYDISYAADYIVLNGTGVPVAGFGDSACSQPLAGRIVSGQSTQALWIQPAAAGLMLPVLDHLDFWHRVSAYGVLDAGALADAGRSDAGASDSGPLDSGLLDSGLPDAGPADAGGRAPVAPPSPALAVSCGCSAGAGASFAAAGWGLLGLALRAMRRRRCGLR